MANAQAAAGDEVIVHTVDYGRREMQETVTRNYELVLHKKIPFLWDLMGTAGNPFVPTVRKAVRKSGADVVHLHSHLFFASLFGLQGARRKGIPTVLTVHGVRAVRGPLTNLLQEAWLRSLSRHLFRHCDRIVCLTKRDADEVQAYGASPAKTRVLFNAYDQAVFFPGSRGDADVVWVGRYVPEKGLVHLIAAWEQVVAAVPRATLTLVGDGPDREAIAAEVERRGMGSVRMLGVKTQVEVARLLRSAAVFVLPSLQEGFPKALLEAMASGLPVVTTPTLSEIVQDAGLTCDPTDHEALATALIQLLTSPQGAAEMGNRGAHLARSKYSWDALVASTNAVYNEATADHVSPATIN